MDATTLKELDSWYSSTLTFYIIWYAVYLGLGVTSIVGASAAAMDLKDAAGVSRWNPRVCAAIAALSASLFGFLKPNDYVNGYDAALTVIAKARVSYSTKQMTDQQAVAELNKAIDLTAFKYGGLAAGTPQKDEPRQALPNPPVPAAGMPKPKMDPAALAKLKQEADQAAIVADAAVKAHSAAEDKARASAATAQAAEDKAQQAASEAKATAGAPDGESKAKRAKELEEAAKRTRELAAADKAAAENSKKEADRLAGEAKKLADQVASAGR